jgi:hypothetical protein
MSRVNRMVETVRKVLASSYDRFVFTEHDSLFLSRVPETPEEAFSACLKGESDSDYGKLPLLDLPFIVHRRTLAQWLRAADKVILGMIMANKWDDYPMELFASIACNRGLIPVFNLGGVHSFQGGKYASDLVVSRKMVEDGIWLLKHVTRNDHLAFILSKSDAIPQEAIMQ